METIKLTAAQETEADNQAGSWALFCEFVDPDGAIARSEEEFQATPYAERLQAARESIAYNQ